MLGSVAEFFHEGRIFGQRVICRHIHRVAIVGSGPSGCYTAKYLHSAFVKRGFDSSFIHVIDRLPTPYGLVRYGVAPDHPEVKNVQNDFDNLFQEKGVQFYGNVTVGRNVSVEELRNLYDVVVLAYGCESDRKLSIPGEDLIGVISAREFVAWYNGHPDYTHIGDKVAQALRVRGDHYHQGLRQASVVVIGQGNVALDCARILAKASPGLYNTDIAAHALPILGDGVSRVTILGRRGHIQGAFTIKEIRELVKLQEEGFDASFHVRVDELKMGENDASLAELNGAQGRPKSRINQLLHEAALNATESSASKQIHLRFLLNPVKFLPSEIDSNSVGFIVCERTRLEGDVGHVKAIGTGEFENIHADLALVSIGYRGLALSGTEQWYDGGRGILLNDHGRVEYATKGLGLLYCAGWLKRGPSGIIGTNITDAKDTVATIMKDLDIYPQRQPHGDLASLLKERKVPVIRWEDYLRIEQYEHSSRRSEDQPREKIASIQKMIQVALASKDEEALS